MINVKETFKLNTGETVLVCEMFEDDIVTNKIESNVGDITGFEVEKPKNCFGTSMTRNIVVFNLPNECVVNNLMFV